MSEPMIHLSERDFKKIVRDALSEIWRPVGIDIWMRSHQDRFDGMNVDQMIRAGRAEDVLIEVQKIRDGGYA